MTDTVARYDPDAQQLADLGYTSEFHRDMSLWANFSLGFTYLVRRRRSCARAGARGAGLRRGHRRRERRPGGRRAHHGVRRGQCEGRAGRRAGVVPVVRDEPAGYGIAAILNMVWPRTPDAPWYDDYLVLLSGVVVVGAGLVLMAVLRPYRNSDAIAGDAVDASER